MNGLAEEMSTDQSATLWRTGQIGTYDGNGTKIDFQNSGQDGDLQRGEPWPEPRFINNGDGTITDIMTGLIWLKDGKCFGTLKWHSAGKAVDAFNDNPKVFECTNYSASFSDWHLPTLTDLSSLLNANESILSNYLNLQGFSAVQTGMYWTGSTYMNSLNAWSVDFRDGTISYKGKMENLFLLLVRHPVAGKSQGVITARHALEESLPENIDAIAGDSVRRFVDNGDGTITDITTNLMWLRDAGCFPQEQWQEAFEAISSLNEKARESPCQGYTASYEDWIMPNRVELRSLVDYNHDFPALIASHPFERLRSSYWSSTTDVSEPKMGFSVDLYTGPVIPVAKQTPLAVLPVRDAVPVAKNPRKVSHAGLGAEIDEKFILTIAPDFRMELRWPPEPRFFDNGDGTSMDRITGYNWLTDGSCFGKLSWKEIFVKVAVFNSTPEEIGCEGYEATFGDWMAPSIDELNEFINKKEKDSAAWLNGQGLKNIQASGDYWSATPTMVNLYYAYVISLKTGKIRNYPKALKFFFWPRRVLPDSPNKEPLLNITVNAISAAVSLELGEIFSVSLYLHTFGIRTPADFWLWYETPDGQKVWLSGIRTWKSLMTPLYQGDLFNLKNYEIFAVANKMLAEGDYTLHFAVDLDKNGILDTMHFENQMVVTIKAKE